MRYHDFHLTGYEVRQFGAEIVLHLELSGEQSHIRFTDVALYHFDQAGGTIIFGVDEVPVSAILDAHWQRILQWANGIGGVPHWDRDDRNAYQAKLEAAGYRAWDISSSIGFTGFVIAKCIADVTTQYRQPLNQALEATATR
jgi:hypothetical protein